MMLVGTQPIPVLGRGSQDDDGKIPGVLGRAQRREHLEAAESGEIEKASIRETVTSGDTRSKWSAES
jgi:hypothetical protein